MQEKALLRNPMFWLGLVIVVGAALISIATYYHWISLHILLGPFYLHHWMSWTGVAFIAIFNPIYAIWKRRSPRQYSSLSRIHVIGNLLAFTLISIHFAHHMGRQAAPEGNTGLVMYLSVAILVVTGFILRFQLIKQWMKFVRYIHSSVITTFYIIVVINILVGLKII
jgi:hypothetical protein